MKQRQSIFGRVTRQFNKIKLVDRYLIVVMLILMVQSLIGLFTPFGDQSITDRIDVVMRTTMASIFGYFVSANFIKHDPADDDGEEEALATWTAKITPEILAESLDPNENGSKCQNVIEQILQPADQGARQKKKQQLNLQVKVVGCVCVFSIFALVLIRYFAYDNTDSLAVVFLFRDFVCGCVGFLIGMPNESPAQ